LSIISTIRHCGCRIGRRPANKTARRKIKITRRKIKIACRKNHQVAHLRTSLPSRDVRAFRDAGIASGGTDDGPPGPRNLSRILLWAFLRDLDGNRIEAVGHH
jgi:hypothetical protein